MASLSLKNVTKKYPNGFVAVKDFNLEIADKEFIIFVGPSGCGKSTTLRMIAGLEDISSGELYIDDKLVNDVEPKDRDIAMVFQNYALYPHMSVYDNMAFGLKLRKTPKDEIDKKVHDAAKILDLEHLLDRKPKALSGGQLHLAAVHPDPKGGRLRVDTEIDVVHGYPIDKDIADLAGNLDHIVTGDAQIIGDIVRTVRTDQLVRQVLHGKCITISGKQLGRHIFLRIVVLHHQGKRTQH